MGLPGRGGWINTFDEMNPVAQSFTLLDVIQGSAQSQSRLVCFIFCVDAKLTVCL